MKPNKFLIFDAGPLISFALNGLLPVLEKLKKDFDGEFVITSDVKREVVDKPLKIKKYALEGIKIQSLLSKGILKNASDFVSESLIEKEKKRILKTANSSFISYEKIELIHDGEASCLAFSNICNSPNIIVIDERTTRLISENPENLKALFEKKLHTTISLNKETLKEFKKFRFIRSSELIYFAFKKNLLDLKKDKTTLDALLYALKYSGTTISSREIEELKLLA